MGVVELLNRCRAAGLSVAAEGDRLKVRGPKKAAALVAELQQRKPEVLQALSAPSPRRSSATADVRIESVEHARSAYGREVFTSGTAFRLVRASDREPLNLGLCVSESWARALAAEHGLRVIAD